MSKRSTERHQTEGTRSREARNDVGHQTRRPHVHHSTPAVGSGREESETQSGGMGAARVRRARGTRRAGRGGGGGTASRRAADLARRASRRRIPRPAVDGARYPRASVSLAGLTEQPFSINFHPWIGCARVRPCTLLLMQAAADVQCASLTLDGGAVRARRAAAGAGSSLSLWLAMRSDRGAGASNAKRSSGVDALLRSLRRENPLARVLSGDGDRPDVVVLTPMTQTVPIAERLLPTQERNIWGACMSYPKCRWCTVLAGPRADFYEPPCGAGPRGTRK